MLQLEPMIRREYYGRINREKQFRAGWRVAQNYRLVKTRFGVVLDRTLAGLLFTGEQYSSLKTDPISRIVFSPRDLIHSFRDHGSDAGKILDQLLGHAVPCLQILRVVVSQPDFPDGILGHQRLER